MVHRLFNRVDCSLMKLVSYPPGRKSLYSLLRLLAYLEISLPDTSVEQDDAYAHRVLREVLKNEHKS